MCVQQFGNNYNKRQDFKEQPTASVASFTNSSSILRTKQLCSLWNVVHIWRVKKLSHELYPAMLQIHLESESEDEVEGI